MKRIFGIQVVSHAALGLIAVAAFGGEVAAQVSKLPEIRLSQTNTVPACVTPDRLMAFLRQRNGNLDRRFRNIAHYYQQHGEAWRVRWDYAFFQMAIETNFLTYLRPNGRMGDVDPRQNNFAGIGTTGGGVPGDSFPDVSTGVLGQIQHLVAYSGEMVDNPVASRTRLKQEHILALSRKLNRPVLFSDLARRWAVDPKYANSIEWVAGRYRAQFCGRDSTPAEAEVLPWHRTPSARRGADAAPPSAMNLASLGLPARKSSVLASPASGAMPDTETVDEVAAKDAAVLPGAQVAAQDVETAEIEISALASNSVFALFTPPAGLAEILPSSAGIASRDLPQPVLEQAPVANDFGAPASSVAEAPAAADPQTVAGTSVGGFMIAGVSPTARPAFDPPSGLGVKPGRCAIETASYGGQTTVLVRTRSGADVQYVALSVLDGFEETMTNSFLSARPEGGEALGTFASRELALKTAREHCPDAG